MTGLLPTILLPITLGAVGYFLPRRLYQGLLLAGQAAQVVLVTRLFVMVRTGGPIRVVLADWPEGVGIALQADLLSSTLVALAGWFFLLMLLFNTRKLYMDRLFQFLFVLLQGLLIGLFLSGDLFNIYVLLELSTLVISVLIMYKRNKQTIYDGMVYLMINLASMSFMLLGIGFVYRALGTLDLAQLARRIAEVANPRSLILGFSLVMTGIGVKSALFLLFGWLPKAHGAPSAPAVVSAILSGIQVKAGLYLFLRLIVTFETAIVLRPFFLVVGFLTALTGVGLAMVQHRIKSLLAYSTVSQIGLIVVGLTAGAAGSPSTWGGVFHMVNHAVVKALLFLCAGLVIHVYGTKELSQVRGVLRKMPAIGLAMALGILGIIGTPLFGAGVSKYFIGGGLSANPVDWGILLVNLGTSLTFVKFGHMLFGRPEIPALVVDGGDHSRQPDAFTRTIVVILGAATLLAGVFAQPVIALLFGLDVDASGAWSAQKILIYAVTIAMAVLLYRFVLAPATEKIRRISRPVYFADYALGILVFFAATTAYGYLAG